MEFETWWLLGIPIFFGLGWIAARVDINQLVSESRSLPKGYFRGLNFLLNEQPDKAIDAFIDSQVLIPGKWQPVPSEKLNSNTLKSQLLQKIQQNLETYKESI